MIAEECLEKINVCETYFEVDDRPIVKYSSLFDVNGIIYMNKVVSRNNAIRLVSRDCGVGINRVVCLYASSDIIAASFVRDFNGNEIFHFTNEKVCGWFFQYDPTPFANWYHKCWYYFVVNESCFYKIESNCGICDTLDMEMIY